MSTPPPSHAVPATREALRAHPDAPVPPRPGALRVAALTTAGAMLAVSAALQAVVGVPHLIEDVRELAARDAGGRPHLLAAVAAGLWLGVAALAAFAGVVVHAAWQGRRRRRPARGTLRLVGVACLAYGLALALGLAWSPHALGYVAIEVLVLAGAGAPAGAASGPGPR